ncbi:uncharacterized protein LOC129748543 [Uranotaenia lowii]|uniref:uncharacterized protein LOC129748543 n=1 Tax=Uranotaenia lowii TaxID=190385 RepID=UPI00247A4BD3|nr:uncharacterized protein LOC129748543 [Uranotaenia lowii]
MMTTKSFPLLLLLLIRLLLRISSDEAPHMATVTLALHCLEYIYERNIQPGEVTYILRNDTLLDDGFYRLANARGSLLIGNVKSSEPGKPSTEKFLHRFDQISNYVLVFRTTVRLQQQLAFVAESPAYNSRVFFILVMLDDDENFDPDPPRDCFCADCCARESSKLAAVFRLLWQFYIHNFLLIHCPESEPHHCPIYTWFPYGRYSSCTENFFNYERIDRCSRGRNFPPLLVEYLNGPLEEYETHLVPDDDPPMGTEIFHTSPPSDPVEIDEQNCPYQQQQPNQSICIPNQFFFTAERLRAKDFQRPQTKNSAPTGTIEMRSSAGPLQEPPTSDPHFVRQALGTYPSDFPASDHPERVISPRKPHFFHKVPDDLGGCRVRALLAIWPPFVTDPARTDWIGMEHKLALDVGRFMNFRLQEQYSSDGIQGLMEAFKSQSVELCFGNLYPRFDRHEETDHSVGYLHDEIDWVVPLAGSQPLWMNLGAAFSIPIWITIFATMTMFSILYVTSSSLAEMFPHTFLDSFGAMLGVSLRIIPEKFLGRILFILWSVYCMHLCIFYQSKMIDILTRPPGQRQISTLGELIQSEMAVGFPENFVIHLERLNSSEIDEILKRRIECTAESCLSRLEHGSFATMGNRMYLQYSAAHQIRATRFYQLHELVARSFVQMIMKKGLPLRDHINKKIRSMVEAGYFVAVERVFYAMTQSASMASNQERSVEVRSLTLEHFQGAFLILAIGSGLAFFAVIAELIVGKFTGAKLQEAMLKPKAPFKPFVH